MEVFCLSIFVVKVKLKACDMSTTAEITVYKIMYEEIGMILEDKIYKLKIESLGRYELVVD